MKPLLQENNRDNMSKTELRMLIADLTSGERERTFPTHMHNDKVDEKEDKKAVEPITKEYIEGVYDPYIGSLTNKRQIDLLNLRKTDAIDYYIRNIDPWTKSVEDTNGEEVCNAGWCDCCY